MKIVEDLSFLYIDEEDRKILESYSEVEREKILNKRYREIKEIENMKNLKKEDVLEQKKELNFSEADFIVPKSIIVDNVYKPIIYKIKGCFVKVKIGDKYFIGKIVDVYEGEIYVVSLSSTRSVRMCLYFTIDIGDKLYKDFKILNISDRKLEEEEFRLFVDKFEIVNLKPLNRKYTSFINETKRGLNDDEMVAMVNNRNKMNPKKQNNTDKLIDLIKKREMAIDNKNKAEALEYQKKIMELEEEDKRYQK